MRQDVSRSRPRSRPAWQRHLAAGVLGLFAWSAVLAVPAQALAHPITQKPPGVRSLSLLEMQHITGRQMGVGGEGGEVMHGIAVDAASGSTYPWEASAGGTNTGNGNKMTSMPLTGWTALGGMPVGFSLVHNSQSNHNSELGFKWTHSFDLFLVASTGVGGTDLTAHWGDDLAYKFTQNVDGSYSAPNGIHDTLVHNSNGTYTLTRPDQTTYHYTSSYYCDLITDRNSNAVALTYNSGNFVTTITDPTGRTITLGYNSSNKITSVTDPLSHVWTIAYDTSGNLSTITYPVLGSTYYSESFGYNSAHDVTTFTDKRGHSWTFTYNSADNSLATESDPYSNQTSYAYTSSATTITDSNGHAVIYTYSGGKNSQVTDAASQSESYVYDGSNNKTQVTDRRGYVWNSTFDSKGNVLTSTDPYSNVTATATFNSHNFPLTTTDALGNQTVNTFDSHDNLTQSQRKDSFSTVLSTSSISYNADGTVASTTDGNSHTTTFGYSANGNVTSVTDANSHTSTVTVNAMGWKTGVSDALSHSSSFTLDAWGRATSVTTPAGTTTSVYDANSNITSATDANSRTNTSTFDFDNRPLVVTKANGDAVTYAYDATGKKGLLSTKTDGNSHVTTYSYTSRNQPYITTYPDSTTESWSYNNDGSVASHADGNSHTISYGYDHRGLLTSVSYPAGTGISYTYDVAGQKTAMTDATGSTSYTPDAAGRITSVTTPNGTVGYAYDTANLRTSMSLTGTGTWSYTYDAGNRLTQVTNPSSESTTFSYDNANRQTGQTSANSSTVTTTFDNANRTTEILHKNSSNATLADYQYSYDGAGNVSTRTDSDGTVTSFGYDNSDQLTSEVRDNSHSTGYALAYTYDNNQNRLTKVVGTGGGAVTTTNTYGTHDQLLTSGSKSYVYDYNGNCTSVTVGSNVTSLTYDYENRVTGITYPSSATNSFTYNGNDLRMQKVDSAGTANYVCDGTTPASSVLKDGSAVYTPGLSERRGSTSKFYHGDALGSTRGITNASQAVTDSVLYDGFGMTVSRTGTTPTPFGFVGSGQYQTDNDSGLMLLGHRYYDASVGRFISSDPAKAGDNWYAYCNNSPLTQADPQGLDGDDRVTRSEKITADPNYYAATCGGDATDCGVFVGGVVRGGSDSGYPASGTSTQWDYIKNHPVHWKSGGVIDPGGLHPGDILMITGDERGTRFGHTGIYGGSVEVPKDPKDPSKGTVTRYITYEGSKGSHRPIKKLQPWDGIKNRFRHYGRTF
jgi:RHS repeat-associated protein